MIAWASVLFALLIFRWTCWARTPLWPELVAPLPPGVYRVVSIDADRIRLSNRELTGSIKLLGIEFVRTDMEIYLQRRLLGQIVRIRFDRRRVDPQQIQLAYVYLDHTLINGELVRQGYARAATRREDYPPIRREIEASERHVRSRSQGIERSELEKR